MKSVLPRRLLSFTCFVKANIISLVFRILLVFSLTLSLLTQATLPIYLSASSPWTQTDWSGGSGQASFSDTSRYDSASNINSSSTGQLTLTNTSTWYNGSWAYRKKITFNNSAQAENLINFPVLVKLTSSNIDYGKTKAGGADIRFTDSDGTTELKYEIEKWDSSGSSFVWVKVPQIDSSSSTDSIYLYYGNTSASDAQDPANVWNSNYAIVQHLEETATCPTDYSDSTSNDNDAVCNDTPVATTGQVDGARSFNGSDPEYIFATDDSLYTNNQLTVSIWANQSSLSAAKAMITKWFHGVQGSWALQTDNSDNTRLQVFIANALADAGDNNGYTESGSWSTGWHQVTFTYDSSGSGNSGKLKIYIDGAARTLSFNGTIPSTMQDSDTNLRIGEFGNLSRYWNGSLDEVRVSTSVQSAAWVAASYKSEADTFNSYGSEEQYYASSGTLTSSIFDTEQVSLWGTLSYSVSNPTSTTTTVKVRTSNSSTMSGAAAFSSCNSISSGTDLSSTNCVTDSQRYVQYQVTLATTAPASSPTFQDIAIGFAAADSDAPGLTLNSVASPTTNTSPTVTGTTTDAIGNITSVEFQIDGTSGSWSACSASDGSFNSSSESFYCQPTIALTDGLHTIYVRATDSNSNVTANSSTSFIVDTTAPNAVTLLIPTQDEKLTNIRPQFSWQAASPPDNASGIQKYQLKMVQEGGANITIDNIPAYHDTTYQTDMFTVTYQNFSDAEPGNNRLVLETKSSALWPAAASNGQLNTGKVIWTVVAFDNVNLTKEVSGIFTVASETPVVPSPTPSLTTSVGLQPLVTVSPIPSSSAISPALSPATTATPSPTTITNDRVLEEPESATKGVATVISEGVGAVKDFIVATLSKLTEAIQSTTGRVLASISSTFSQTASLANNIQLIVVGWIKPETTKIYNLKVVELGKDYAVIGWRTNHPATSKVSFGETPDYGQDVQDDQKVTDRRLTISGLKPGQKYFYEAMSQGKTYVYDARHEFETLKE